MPGDTSVLVTAIGGAVATIIGAWALLTNARSKAARPAQILRRLWDWIETAGHREEIPETLRDDVVRVLDEDGDRR